MKFIDIAKLKVKAGKGGNGMISFRRELYVPRGGPDGGDGGAGGDIIFVGDSGLTTLLDLRNHKLITTTDGENGKTKNMFGKNGAHKYVKVPLGTIIYDESNGKVIGDITKHGQQVLVCKGGKGGRGNARFASATNQAPRIAENGMLGDEKLIACELKLLANVGLIGLPNAGKSTFLRAVSNATPQVADYPFTTLTPQLGLVKVYNDTFVIADLPGLIANASMGKGLGLQFLRHIERCQVLVHLLDISATGVDHYLNYQLIKNELAQYSASLLLKPEIVVVNKTDLISDDKIISDLQEKIQKPFFAISALQKQGIMPLLININELVKNEKMHLNTSQINSDHVFYEYEAPAVRTQPEIIINQITKDQWTVSGLTIKNILLRNPLNSDHNILLFDIKLQDIGVYDLLLKAGVKKGDQIQIYDYKMTWK